MRLSMVRLCLILSLSLAGCGTSFDIQGRWEGNDAENGKQIFIFEPGGTCRWILEFGPQSRTYDVRYQLDLEAEPARLKLTGFTDGPLEDLALYCVLDRPESGALRLECRPAPPEPHNDALYPKSFGRQAVTVRKVS